MDFFGKLKKKIWQGEFQIVLENKKQTQASTLDILNLSLPSFVSTGSNKIKTEIAILESPSVLMNIFDYVKKQKSSESSKNLRFKTWKKNQ